MRLYGDASNCTVNVLRLCRLRSDLITLSRDQLHCLADYLDTAGKSWVRACSTTENMSHNMFTVRRDSEKKDFMILLKNCEKCPQQPEYDAAISCYIGFNLSPQPRHCFSQNKDDCTGLGHLDINLGIKLNKEGKMPPQPVSDPNNFLSNISVSNGNVSETQLSLDDKHESASHFICVSYAILTSISEKPQEGVCQLTADTQNMAVDDILSKCGLSDRKAKHQVRLEISGDDCKKHGDLLKDIKVKWVSAKLNYGLVGLNAITVLIMWSLRISDRKKRGIVLHVLVASNVLWLAWRAQETVQIETRWRDEIPYLCIVTGSLGYTTQTVSFYIMVGFSMMRMCAIVSPLKWQQSRQHEKTFTVTALCCGLLAGIICSAFNTAVVLTMDDPTVRQLCKLYSIAKEESMQFLLAVKVISIIFVYLLPCFTLMGCNVASLVSLRKSTSMTPAVHGNSSSNRQRATRNLSFMCITSLLIVLYLPQPIFDLKRAIQMFCYASTGLVESQSEIIAESVFTNLTVIVLFLNTLVGIKFSQ